MAKIPFERFGGPGGADFLAAALQADAERCPTCGQHDNCGDCDHTPVLTCPECGDPVWDGPEGSKLAKCWNAGGHASGAPLTFDTMTDDEDDPRRYIIVRNVKQAWDADAVVYLNGSGEWDVFDQARVYFQDERDSPNELPEDGEWVQVQS